MAVILKYIPELSCFVFMQEEIFNYMIIEMCGHSVNTDVFLLLTHTDFVVLRRISCHGRNHSQASYEYSLTIFLCCQHHSEYSLLGSKFSTNLLFPASKCHVTMHQRGSSSVQNGRNGWDRCSGETLLAPCTRKKRLQRKITKHYHWIGVQENIGMFSKS